MESEKKSLDTLLWSKDWGISAIDILVGSLLTAWTVWALFHYKDAALTIKEFPL